MKKIIIFLVLAGLAGASVYFFKDKTPTLPQEQVLTEESGEPAELPPIEPDKIFLEPITFGQLKETYSGGIFSFKYDSGFKAMSTIQDKYEVITVENAKGSGFQVTVIPFDEKGPITPERIQEDIPGLEVNDPKWADLDGVKVVIFYSFDESIGETFELWPIYKGKMYQIMGPKVAEQLIVETLNTWDWK